MYLLREKLKNNIYTTGLICTSLSLFIFCLPFLVNVEDENNFSLFVFNFLATGIYFVVRLVNRNRHEQEKIHDLFWFLILFLVSAYSLNREMSVFENSADWFAGLLTVLCINYLSFAFFDGMANWLKYTVSFINGIALVSFLYLAIYLMPLYAVGLVGAFLLGVSLHTFVPLLFVIYTIVLQDRIAGSKKYWTSFASGIVGVLLFVGVYLFQWSRVSTDIHNTLSESRTTNTGLPNWVNISRKIPRNNFSKKILKADLVYSVPESQEFDFFWRIPQRNFGEERKHDPLVMLAVFFSGKSHLPVKDRIKLLESMYDMRHEAEDRLWSGDHLFTASVNTAIKVWPQCNIGYTEKTITVTNADGPYRWPLQEEAIYTFYMPEGSVVTSLSLWIEGKEEKGILTTKELADSAYKTVVGVERRDPSVVHWQEGNTVSVRVFPVIKGKSRMFKIGITAPLKKVDGKLRYENVYFKGPNFVEADENIIVDFEQPAADFQAPGSFVSMPSKQSYKRKGGYIPYWSMQFEDPGLSDCSFSFDGSRYFLSAYHKKFEPIQFESIYLDINSAWTKDEYDQVLDCTKGKSVFVYTDKLVKVDDSNKQDLWRNLREIQFSLFPLYEIADPNQSLLITKSASYSPNIDDLENTGFLAQTKKFLSSNPKVRLFNIGKTLTPYLKSLKELRAFQYDSGDMAMLQRSIQKSHFAEDIENDNSIVIHGSDMVINKTGGEDDSAGPDHLMRLFAYNHILQKLGKDILVKRPIEDSLVQEARKAYVVTPVSSLVVLETQQDYDRFNIQDTDNSLKNASMKSKGAVPEPHEWALIIAVGLVLLFVIRKRRFQVHA